MYVHALYELDGPTWAILPAAGDIYSTEAPSLKLGIHIYNHHLVSELYGLDFSPFLGVVRRRLGILETPPTCSIMPIYSVGTYVFILASVLLNPAIACLPLHSKLNDSMRQCLQHKKTRRVHLTPGTT